MSDQMRTVSLGQLDELLDADVKIAELQAKDYIARGQTSMATHVLTTAIENRGRERSRILAQAQHQARAETPQPPQPPATQPQAAQPAAPAQATGPLAAPGSPPPAAPNPFLTPRAIAKAPPCVRQQIFQQAQAANAEEASSNMGLPFGLRRR